MPAKNDHLQQADHNFALYQAIDSSTYPDWAITILFYAALHYVDAYLATIPMHPNNHGERNTCMRTNDVLKAVYSEYAHIKNMSHNARYYPPTPFTRVDAQNLETTQLASIRSALAPHL